MTVTRLYLFCLLSFCFATHAADTTAASSADTVLAQPLANDGWINCKYNGNNPYTLFYESAISATCGLGPSTSSAADCGNRVTINAQGYPQPTNNACGSDQMCVKNQCVSLSSQGCKSNSKSINTSSYKYGGLTYTVLVDACTKQTSPAPSGKAPLANITTSQSTIAQGTTIELNATNSVSYVGDGKLTYTWSLLSGNANIVSPTAVITNLTASAAVNDFTTDTVQLQVTDSKGNSGYATLPIPVLRSTATVGSCSGTTPKLCQFSCNSSVNRSQNPPLYYDCDLCATGDNDCQRQANNQCASYQLVLNDYKTGKNTCTYANP